MNYYYNWNRYVSQVDLEIADNCQGKYTVGLGQQNMAFVDDREGSYYQCISYLPIYHLLSTN